MLTGLAANPLFFLVYFGALILAITIHEASHAFIAHRLGDSTAKQMGRLTLNPIAHLDLYGSLILPLLLYFMTLGRFLFGWAKPVPVNPHNFKNPKLDNFKVALAGPSSNLTVAVGLSFISRLLPISVPILDILIFVNILLAIFNLLPIPPLDGSKVLGIFLREESYFELERFGPFILLAVLFAGAVGVFPLFTWLLWVINGLFTLLTGSSAI